MLSVDVATEEGPPSAHHAIVVTKEGIFLHGGVTNNHNHDSHPLNTLWRFDPDTNHWTNINDHGPSLSHHGAYQLEDRYLCFVGGWTGKTRSYEVNVYDTRINSWLDLAPTRGFPQGGGLTSHSVTPGQNGVVYIIGRLGGTLTQRRNGSSLKLSGHPSCGFKYEQIDADIPSMSGHTATASKGHKLVLVGGRSEPHKNMLPQSLKLNKLLYSHEFCISKAMGETVDEHSKNKFGSRRYHAAVGDKHGHIIVHGGQGFSELKSIAGGGVRGDLAVWVEDEKKWRQVKLSEESRLPRLSAHSAAIYKEDMYLIGGYAEDWVPNHNTYHLNLV